MQSGATDVNYTSQVTWASDDETVATVAAGLITAVATGSATVTATFGELSAECAVTVPPDEPNALRIEPATATVPLG